MTDERDHERARATQKVEELLQFIETVSGRELTFKTVVNLQTGEQQQAMDRMAEWLLNLEAQVRREALEEAELRRRKDGAYLERNQVVAALAKCFPSGIAKTAIDGWDQEWHGCVYIDLPTGQVSWHYHDSHASLFAGLPPYTKPWDGHTTDEKYQRLTNLQHAEQREQRLREAVQGLLDIGKRDLTNPKYDGYFESLREALGTEPSPSPQGGDAPNRER